MSSTPFPEPSIPAQPAPRVPEGAYARLMFRGPDGHTVEKNVLRYTTVIGSGPTCNIQLIDPEIAEAHCIVTVETGGLRVRDLRTTSGTRVNGRPVQVAALVEGDTIDVGRFSFLVATNLRPTGAAVADDIPAFVEDETPATAELAFVGPDGQPQTKNILRPSTLIGSAPGCNMQLVSAAINHAHCVLTVENGSLRVRDLRSQSGTRVNGVSVEVAALAEGDRLEVGTFAFLIRTNLPRRPLSAELPVLDFETATGESRQAAEAKLAEQAAELERARSEIETERAEFAHAQTARQRELDEQQRRLDEQRESLEQERAELLSTRTELDSTRTAIAATEAELQQQRDELSRAAKELAAAQQQFAAEQKTWAETISAHQAEAAQFAALKESAAADQRELEQRSAEFVDAQNQLAERERQLAELQAAAVADRQSLEQQRRELSEQLTDMERRATAAAAEREQLEKQRQQLETDRAKLAAEREELGAAQQRHREETSKFEEDWLRFEEQKDRDTASSEMLRVRFDELETLRKRLLADEAALRSAREEWTEQQSTADTTQQEQQRRLEEWQQQLQKREQAVSAAETALADGQRALADAEANLQRNREEVAADRTAAQQLREQLERREAELAAAQSALAQQQQSHAEEVARLAAQAVALTEREAEFGQQQTAHHAASEELQRLRQEIAAARERLTADEEQLAAGQQQHAAQWDSLQSDRSSLAALQAAIDEAAARNQSSAEELDADRRRLHAERDQLQAEQQQLQREREEFQAERDRLAADRAEFARQQQELDEQHQQLEARRGELVTMSAELDVQRDEAAIEAARIEQVAAAQTAAQERLAAERNELETQRRQLDADRTELAAALEAHHRSAQELEAEWAVIEEARQTAARAEQVIADRHENLQQCQAAFDEQQAALEQRQREVEQHAEQLQVDRAALAAAQEALAAEQSAWEAERADWLEKQSELEAMADKLEFQELALNEREQELSAARAQFDDEIEAHRLRVAELEGDKERFAQQQLEAASNLIQQLQNGSSAEFQVERDDFELTSSGAADNGQGASEAESRNPEENAAIAAISTTSLAGGGLGRTQIDWLLDGRRYRGFFIGPYRVLELLGTGSTGWLYEAEDTRDGRTVALKVLSAQHLADAGMRARFEQESRASLAVNHPNIVRALTNGKVDDAQYLVMEVAYGATLQELIDLNGPVPCPHACDFALQAARGLQHIHEAGIIHRDIKPANLLVMHSGELKIIDFGLALIRGDADELSLKIDYGHDCMGTPDYIPPEQARDSFSVDATADVYSLGCTLYYALTGRLPYPQDAVNDKLKAHRDWNPPPVCDVVSDVPAEVSGIVAKMMAKDCNDRYQTAAEVAQVLKPFAERSPVYFDFRHVLDQRAETAKKRMFLLANREMSRPVNNTTVARKNGNGRPAAKTAERELTGS